MDTTECLMLNIDRIGLSNANKVTSLAANRELYYPERSVQAD